MATISWERITDEGDEEIILVPATYEVCWDCEGEGKTLNENLRGAFTQDQFYECFDDEESRLEYRKGGKGIYGVPCKTCKGRTTIAEPDTTTEIGKEYAKHLEEMKQEEESDAYTMRMESGCWEY